MDPHGPLARQLRIALALAALAGALVFGLLLAATFLVPDAVERAAQAWVRHEVIEAVRAKAGERRIEAFETAAQRLRRQLGEESATLRRLRQAPVEGEVHHAIDRLCRTGCVPAMHVAADRDSAARHYTAMLWHNEAALERVTGWIQGKYLEVVRELTHEVRIFLGCNAALFLAVAGLAPLGQRPARAILLPAAALFFGTVCSTLVYVVGQDWLFALIHNTYVGWGYLAWCAGMSVLCLDVAANKGRGTLVVLGLAVEALAALIGMVAACCP